ncbi:hypothetical protein CBR_g63107 [Chara braunii]|uniref:Reverse transcriptase n=1 Tax=Chara braunii TaxID=69332 RepID=A0A388K8Z9_CHABU|nr:hypothetical protein CBR_g63107 [Chara braunii]|eukprot:GBG66525.1 hypothetical protein CBR_g63107 [Chara braunii]
MMRNMRPIAVRAPMQGGMAAAQVAAGPAGTAANACFTCHQPGHLARDCPHRAMQPRAGVAPAAAAPIANGPGRVGAVMDDQGGSNGMMISSEEAAELIPLKQYVSLGYPGLGMIGTIRPELESRDVAEWRPSSSKMETGGPTFVTGEIDVLEVTRALDHRIPLSIGHLRSISEQANERMMQHCKANRKRFALARAKDQKAKAPTLEEKADVAPDSIRVGLIQKDDHFLRSKPILWKSTECDIEVWGVPYSAIIDSGAAVLAISLRVVERAGRKNDLIMLTEKDQLVLADEEMLKTVGRMTNVAFRLGKVHALGDVVVLDVNTYDVLFKLPALVALRANLNFERRSVILRNIGGKPYVIPIRLTLRTSVKVNVRILDQMYELHVPQYVPDEIHRLIADILIEYQGAISVSDVDIGLSVVVQHEIQTGNHSPIHCKPYRYSLTERKTALQRIREFEANRWIEPATGPWSFPVVLVPKKNGSVRICIDYRKLNDITIKDVYPLPRIDDLLDAIGCANYFSKFDIQHRFHHILVKEEDRPKTAFVLFEGTWQWVRCPMGICNAPATFQRAMNVTFHNFVNKTRLTQGMINFCVIVYMDDILVYSDTFHGHAQHIELTLGSLRDAGFKIALEKSEFFLPEISFLGYVVTRGGLRPDSRKVAAVKEAPVPTSLTQVRAFLGLASYYRRFIKGFAAIARPLTNLQRKEQPLHWDDECDQAFGTLKDALVMAPILIRPDPSRQFILITDWQPEAISAILAQKGNDGKEHVIEYASRTVPDERRNDFALQGECYAVVWGIQHFHPYLYGQKFLLVTDHEPLLALKKLTNYTGMIGRWAMRLQEYEFDIVHRKTERHGNADGLTCLHRPERPRCRGLLTQELTVPIAQLADDLDVSIVSQVDPRLVPHVTSRTLSPYLQWSACVEGFPSRIPPSRLDYLDPRDIVDPAFYRPSYEDELEEIIREELAEESSEEEEENPNEDEEGSAQQREGEEDELLQMENEEEEEEEDSEQGSGDDNDEEHADEDPQLEIAPVADLQISNDPTLDPEPPQPDDDDVAQMAGPCLQVLVSALPVLEGAVEAAFGSILKSYSAYKEPTSPELLNIRFDLTTSARIRYKPYLTIDLSEFGYVDIEVVCADTPWCPDCRRFFHSAGDPDCPTNKRKKTYPQKSKGKAPVEEESEKEKDKGNGRRKQKEKTSKQKVDQTFQPQNKSGGGRDDHKTQNKENLSESSKGWQMVVWRGRKKMTYMPKGDANLAGDEATKAVDKPGDKAGESEEGQADKTAKEKDWEEEGGKEDIRQKPQTEAEEEGDGKKIDDSEQMDEDGENEEDALIRKKKGDNKAEATDRDLRDMDSMRKANPFWKPVPDSSSDKGQTEKPLVENLGEDEVSTKNERIFIIDDEDILGEGNEAEEKMKGHRVVPEGEDEEVEEEEEERGTGEKSEAESGEESDRDLLGFMGKELEGDPQGQTKSSAEKTDVPDLRSGPSTPVGEKTAGLGSFKIYDNLFFRPVPSVSEPQHLQHPEGISPSILGGSGTLQRGGRRWNDTLKGDSPSKRKKVLEGRGVGSYSAGHRVSTTAILPLDLTKTRKRSFLHQTGGKQLSFAGPMKTLTKRDKVKGPAKSYLAPLICSETPLGTMVLTRILTNEALEIPVIQVNSPPTEGEVLDLTKRHVLNHTRSVSILPTMKRMKISMAPTQG